MNQRCLDVFEIFSFKTEAGAFFQIAENYRGSYFQDNGCLSANFVFPDHQTCRSRVLFQGAVGRVLW